MGQIIQYAPNLPELAEHPVNYAYLVEGFVPYVRNAFRDAGWLKTENSRDEGGQLLVGIRGEIYVIESDFSVHRYADGFDAIGCGAQYALGALRILKTIGSEDDPRVFVNLALEAAAYFSNGVSSPFVYEVLV